MKKLIAIVATILTVSALQAHELTAELGWFPKSVSVDWNHPETKYIDTAGLYNVDVQGELDLPLGFFLDGDVQAYMFDGAFADGSFGLGWKRGWFSVSADRAWLGSVDSLGYSMRLPFVSGNSWVNTVSARGDGSFEAFDGEGSTFFAEVGWVPLMGVDIDWNEANEATWIDRENAFYVDLGLRLGLPLGFSLNGDSKTYMTRNGSTGNFAPFFTDYAIGIDWTHDRFTVGFEHTCCHAVDPNGHRAKAPAIGKDVTFERLYVKYSFGL